MRTIQRIAAAAAIALGCPGCHGSSLGPTAAAEPVLAMFLDRATGYTTSDVFDAQGQVIRFNVDGELIFAASGKRFPGYLADGEVITAGSICTGCYFLVRFGRASGVLRAYLTWSAPETPGNPPKVLALDVTDDHLSVNESEMAVPND